jgi:hypothetical protein
MIETFFMITGAVFVAALALLGLIVIVVALKGP